MECIIIAKEENETAKNSALSITNLVIKTHAKYIDC